MLLLYYYMQRLREKPIIIYLLLKKTPPPPYSFCCGCRGPVFLRPAVRNGSKDIPVPACVFAEGAVLVIFRRSEKIAHCAVLARTVHGVSPQDGTLFIVVHICQHTCQRVFPAGDIRLIQTELVHILSKFRRHRRTLLPIVVRLLRHFRRCRSCRRIPAGRCKASAAIEADDLRFITANVPYCKPGNRSDQKAGTANSQKFKNPSASAQKSPRPSL